MSHQEWIELLGDERSGRLLQEDRRALSAHLASCDDCRSLADTYRVLDAAIDGPGASRHPPSADVVAFALGDPALGEGAKRAVVAHLESCAACAEEVAITRGVEAAAAAGRGPGPERRRGRALQLAAAVALFALGLLLGRSWLAPRPVGGPAWGGALAMHLLAPALRTPSEPPTVRLDESQPQTLLGLELDPDSLPTVGRLGMELRRSDGETVWSAEVPAAAAAGAVAASGVLPVLVPTAALRPGAYTLRLVAEPGAGAPLAVLALTVRR